MRYSAQPKDAQPAGSRQQRKNKKSRRRWLERLTELWPDAFSLSSPRPLTVGIIDEISAELNAAGASGHGAVRYAVKSYLNNIRYIRALAAGGPRFNLMGQPCELVSEEEQQIAAHCLSDMMQANIQFFDQVKP
ncbi:ProQ/FINO family protein [Lelliottia wanjuensis]|uniref:ProQ/FINO family protein n=1 Tax=Lelliottia wanjuensis TaxID=3050585 RepID=UPI0025501E8C|nr:ProQ/FINO family protein [Lelliottia sp. V104_15]MDK9605515.1 ProQ/FINO family protein [Lelliottia sp. V104_15]